MGTRGAWGLIKDGKEKVTYNHYDSYPDGLGVCIIELAQDLSISQIYDRIEMVKSEDELTAEQWAYCDTMGSIRMGVGNPQDRDCFRLERTSSSCRTAQVSLPFAGDLGRMVRLYQSPLGPRADQLSTSRRGAGDGDVSDLVASL